MFFGNLPDIRQYQGIEGIDRNSTLMFDAFSSTFGNNFIGFSSMFGMFGSFLSSGFGGGSSKFPTDLKDDLYVVIRVFDNQLASYKQFAISNDLVGGMVGDINFLRAFASSSKTKEADKAFDENEEKKSKDTLSIDGIASNITDQSGNFLGAIGESIGFVRDALGGFQGFGNANLPRIWKYNLYLPLPNAVSETLSHNYNEERGWLHYFPGGKMAEAAVTAFANFTANVAKLTGGQYVRYNQNKIMMYDSTNFRTFTMTWTLVPNNQNEAKILFEMIRLFKMFSSAGTAAGKLLLTSPYYFSLEFQNKIINDSLRFDEVVLTNIDVNYSPTGNMELYNDNTPKAVTLTLTFKDRQPKVREDWAKNPSAGGPMLPESQCSDISGKGGDGKETSKSGGGQEEGTKDDKAEKDYYGRTYHGDEWGGV